MVRPQHCPLRRRVPHLNFPACLRRLERRRGGIQQILELRNLSPQGLALRRLRRGWELKFRLGGVLLVFGPGNRVLAVVEKRQEAVEILLRERVKLVVMTLSTTERRTQPDRSRGVDSIDQRV